MNLLESIWDLSGQVVFDLKYVKIIPESIDKLSLSIANWIDTIYQDLWKKPSFIKTDADLLLYELIANSVNYCYWYGRSDLRPNGSDSNKMYKLLDEAFFEIEVEKKRRTFALYQIVEEVIESFIGKLVRERFPVLEYRIKHLQEIHKNSHNISSLLSDIEDGTIDYSAEDWIEFIGGIPGYTKDPFLKRAILFIFQVYRKSGLFKDEISKLPIPADYQIPKMLEHFGCIDYHPELLRKVKEGELIPEGSREEIEIRAASIVACSMIAEKAGCTCEQVDSFLWLKRKECTNNFHLTITSNY